jgi:hypothetical protein
MDELPKLKSDRKMEERVAGRLGKIGCSGPYASARAEKSGNCWVRLLLRVGTAMEAGAWCGLGWRRKKEI